MNIVLVVGTTPDYVLRLLALRPGGVVFLSHAIWADDPRVASLSPAIHTAADLDNPIACQAAVARLLAANGPRTPAGIACFDCDSLDRAAAIAERFGVVFASAASIALARSKTASKARWRARGVRCPASARVATAAEARAFQDSVNAPVVIKPLCAAGSELVFLCRDHGEVDSRAALLHDHLARPRADRLMRPLLEGGESVDPTRAFAVEEYVDGAECSVDLWISAGSVKVLRFARKVLEPALGLGTVRAYVAPGELPEGLTSSALHVFLARIASALGLTHGFCMVDFIVRHGVPYAIEATPRPGGDSLPDLARVALDFDILGAALDAASGIAPAVPVKTTDALLRSPAKSANEIVAGDETWLSVNVFAPRTGVLEAVDTSELVKDPRVTAFVARREPGETVALPPESWDQRLIGFALVRARRGDAVAPLARELAARVRVDVRAAS